MARVQQFRGRIAGWGTTSGTRVVVGRWDASPLGAFADVMVERADGERVLLAPTDEVATLVASTYRFDRVEVTPVTVADSPALMPDAASPTPRVPEPWHVAAGPLEARIVVGRRTGLGRALQAVPDRVATSWRFTALTDPVARALLRGVRTRGSAGAGRAEHYGATDVHAVVEVASTWAGEPLGGMAPVDPPVRFGFGSTPRRPAVTDVVTTIVLPR